LLIVSRGLALFVGVTALLTCLSCVPEALSFSLEADPFVQQGGKLTSPEVKELAEQGYSVALAADGATALVGSPSYHGFAGAAWVYVRSGSTWSEQAKLVGSEGSALAQQGHSVALSANGDTALVGGPEDEGPHGEFSGASWVFARSGSVWTQQGKKLVAGGVGASTKARQGSGVALSADGDTALIGAETNGTGGAAFVFTREGETWSQDGGALVGEPETSAGLDGWSVALSGDGDTALIGGPKSDGPKGEPEAGAAWAFKRSGSSWSEQGRLPSGTGAGLGTGQGGSVALSGDGDTALVGGSGYEEGIGAAWVYTRSGETWTEQGGPLQGNDATKPALEGHGVALSESGNTAVIGGDDDDTSHGAAWAFERSGNTWSEQEKLEGTGGEAFDEQGYSVALSADGSTALIGGIGDGGSEGAAWVFARAAEPGEEPETGEPEHKHEPESTPPQNNNPNSSGNTQSTSAATGAEGVATTPRAVEEVLLGCAKRALVLNDVLIRGDRVALEGSAAKGLEGKKVKILFDDHQQVASAIVAADGQFSATAPLPPARLRDTNDARYSAVSGRERSLDLKLTRRLILEPPHASGDTVTLVGQVVPPLVKPIAPIAVQQELECGKTTIITRVTPSASGRFRVTLTVPSQAKAGIYRLISTVRESARSNKGFATYSLPLPAVLG
jgi:hypothetical protein